MSINAKIVINGGELQMQDGSSLVKYLMNWQARTGIKNGTPVSILPAKNMQRCIEDAQLARVWGS